MANAPHRFSDFRPEKAEILYGSSYPMGAVGLRVYRREGR